MLYCLFLAALSLPNNVCNSICSIPYSLLQGHHHHNHHGGGGGASESYASFTALMGDVLMTPLQTAGGGGVGGVGGRVRINLSCWIRIQEGKNDPQK